MIDQFFNEYRFLSNFYTSPFVVDGKEWKTVEHFFQAMKTEIPELREEIRKLPMTSSTKKIGRSIALRSNWESIKENVMWFAVTQKFGQNKHLSGMLLATVPNELVEGNYWHDNTWGNCTCNKCKNIIGKNLLGKILMKVRKGDYYR